MPEYKLLYHTCDSKSCILRAGRAWDRFRQLSTDAARVLWLFGDNKCNWSPQSKFHHARYYQKSLYSFTDKRLERPRAL